MKTTTSHPLVDQLRWTRSEFQREILAIRRLLGQTGLPEFAGNIDAEAPYRA